MVTYSLSMYKIFVKKERKEKNWTEKDPLGVIKFWLNDIVMQAPLPKRESRAHVH